MPPPKAVVFDLGKVLLDFDYGVGLRRMLPRVHLGLDQLNGLLNQSPLLHRYETGELTTSEFFRQFQAATRFQGDLEDFAGLFADIFTAMPPMVALHEQLHRSGVPTYILSNTNELAVRHIRQQFPFFSRFNGHVLSFEHRAMKPAAHLYAVAEDLAALRGPDLLFLDDRPENVAAALARGWRAVVHQDPAESRAHLLAAGLPV